MPPVLLLVGSVLAQATTYTSPPASATLDALAQEVTRYCIDHGGKPPTCPFATWMAWRQGIPAQWVVARCAEVPNIKVEPPISTIVTSATDALPPGEGPVQTASARVKTGSKTAMQGALATRIPVEVSGLAKRPSPTPGGGSFTIRGKVRFPVVDAHVYLDQPGLGVWQRSVDVVPGGGFEVQVPLPDIQGVYYLEVRARTDPREPSTSLLFVPLYVGVDEPAWPENWMEEDVASTSAFDGSTRILQSLNAVRRKQDLAPMVMDARIASVAGDLAATPAWEDLAGPLEKAGLPHLYADTVWMGGATEDVAARWNLMRPGFRSLVLDPNVTRVAVAGRDSPTGARWLVLLVAPVPPLDPAAEAHRLYRAANDLRMGNGGVPFSEDPAAHEIARGLAQQACLGQVGPTDFSKVGPAFQDYKLEDKAVEVSAFSVVQSVVQDRSVYAWRDTLMEPSWSALAVGTCQGNLPDHPGSQMALFVLLKPR